MGENAESQLALRVLCLEDVPKDAELLSEMLTGAGFRVSMDIATGEKPYLSFLKSRKYDIILADYTLPGFNAPMALKLAQQLQPKVPFICVSGTIGEDIAVELLKLGATDYVLKDRPGRLSFAVQRALEEIEQQKERNKAELKKLELVHSIEVHQVELELQNEELIQAKAELAAAAEKYIVLYDFAPSGYFTLSRIGEILQLNLLGAKMLGKDRSQLKNSRFQLFISDDTVPIFRLFMEKAFGSKTLATCEVALPVNGSLPKYVHLTGYPAENGEDCLVTAVDITERKQSEQSLVKLKTAIEKLEASVVITDLEGNIEYANPYFTELTGYTANEYMGKNPKVLNSGYHPKEFYEDLWYTIKSGRTWNGEFYNRKKNGEMYWENAIISPVENSNKDVTHFVAIKTDISQAKKINSELIIAKEHAEQSDRLKSAFLANMSHEIRTPMNGILGFADLLSEPGLESEEQQEYIKIIQLSGARMLNILSEIMNISKIESGLMEVNIEEVNINKQVESVYKLLKPNAEVKAITLLFKNSLPMDEANFQTDREKLFGILSNLVNNAIKYTDEGSIEFGYEIVVEKIHENVEKIHENVEKIHEFSLLQFYVKDTGIGIPKDRQDAIFDRFIQADIADVQARQGAGLGLSIAKAYVEMLGGKIWVESQKGSGSIFYFTLPCNTKEKPPTSI